jgi:primase-polymerase (primpol)-like protein
VVWRYVEERDPETGEVSWDKPPLKVGGGLASSINPKTWSTFPEALAAYQRGNLDGLGFVLHRKEGEMGGLVGLDLDHCYDAATGTIEPWALEIITKMNSYTEVSPSGAGLRIFVFGDLPPGGRKKGDFEHYQVGRYVTVTGQRLDGTPVTIERRQAELEAVHAQFWPPKSKTFTNGHAHYGNGFPFDLNDAEVIRRASEAKNGNKFKALWEGSTHGYASHSEADLALTNHLAFWCGPNPERIDALFRQSGLFRSKWQRDYYRQRTIQKALAGRTEFYDSGRKGATPRKRRKAHAETAAASGTDADEEHDPIHLTDRGNAIRLVQERGSDLRHCHPWRKWLVWSEGRWRKDDAATVTLYTKRMIVNLYRSAVEKAKEIGAALESQEDKEPTT